MSSQEEPYNPLDKSNLGFSVAEALLARKVVPLGNLESFVGAGIYAIYYSGSFPLYQSISKANRDGAYGMPIYVGKAIPAGARKGSFGLSASPGAVLYKRLRDHANSIKEAQNLDLADFHCRYLVVDDIWIPLGESLLIARAQPLWNQVLDGFGNHAPGSGREAQGRSPWDVIHPGRSWATRCAPNKRSETELIQQVRDFFANRPEPRMDP